MPDKHISRCQLVRLVELLCQYGEAKWLDEWYLAFAANWIGDERGAELDRLLAALDASKGAREFRIRRCNGNREAWLACVVEDGAERLNFGSYKTAVSIDALLPWIERVGGPDAKIELQFGAPP